MQSIVVLQDGTKVNIEVQLGNQNYFEREACFIGKMVEAEEGHQA